MVGSNSRVKLKGQISRHEIDNIRDELTLKCIIECNVNATGELVRRATKR